MDMKNRKRVRSWVVTSLVFSCLGWGCSLTESPTPVDPALRATLVQSLSGYEDAPSAEFWQTLSPGQATAALLEIRRDETAPSFVRYRALWALGHYATPLARGEIEGAALGRGEARDALDQRFGIKVFMANYPAEAIPHLSAWLAHADVSIREAAIESVAKTRSTDPAIAAIVKKAAARERVPFLRDRLGKLATAR